ncbi:efflux RND transporter permease subunit [uncultured Cetobacterium sp.]|uniref:efflux RND transporter permease subunit n=1 Tax=uncultured Cetobacterium sp. TaxID=527638 RepID=UPI00260FAAB0|nr:efflux RND transporter permease subunit [uncultured Cetobacterium sp.]
MNIAQFSIKRPVVTMMIIVSMVILGILTLVNLKTQLMPNYNMPMAAIRVSWKGASPDDMEMLVTKEIEKGLTSVEGIKRITTKSTMGKTAITVEFEYGVIIDNKVNDLVTAVSRIRNDLPDDIDEPVIRKTSSYGDRVMLLGIRGDDLINLKSFADNVVIPRLERIDGVGTVSVFGGLEKEISVSIDPERLEAYGLTVTDLYGTMKSSSLNFPSGYIREGDKEYLVKVSGEAKTLEDIQEIVIKNDEGETLYLTDVADVKMGIKDRSSYGRTDGLENIIINIEKSDVGNTIEISKRAQEELKKMEPLLPKGASFTINRDSAKDITKSINTVKNNAITGLVLAGIILFVFLRDWRATLVVTVAIPVSIIATFGFFGAKGMTLNIISLMGLSLGVGMLVDNSIVVLDNIFRHLTELGQDRMEASENGATEVIIPIIASTATTIAVFIPIVLREGRAKEIYKDMAFSITFSLLASLIIAITFVPMVSSRILKSRDRVHEEGRVLKFIKKNYTVVLEKSLRHKLSVILGIVILFVGVVGYGSKNIGGEFMPTTDDGVYSIIAELPSGMEIEKANRVSKELENIVKQDPLTQKYISSVGKEAVSIVVEIGDKSERKQKVQQVMAGMRKKISHIPDIKINMVPRMAFGRGSGRDITLILKSDDLNQLAFASKMITEKISSNSGFADINNSMVNGNPEVRINLDRKKMEYYGVKVNDLTFSVSYQILGGAPIKIKTGNDEVDVSLRLDEQFRNSPEKLQEIRVKSKNGKSVKLKDIATFEIGEGAYGIDKEDKITMVTIDANTVGDMDLVMGQKYITRTIEELGLPKTITYTFGGSGRSMEEVNSQLKFAFMVAMFLIYFILAAQFESYILPLIVMGTVPLSVIGVYSGLLITGQKTNTMVFVGIIMLAGIVVNNAIVLIDYIKILLEREMELKAAIIEAGRTRLRPIFMTTMTTVFGMIPLSLGLGQGSEMYKGMAISVIFGLIFSTLLTLLLIPILFYLYEVGKAHLLKYI